MDIYCPTCGEPWDIDSLHDVATERGYDHFQAKMDYPDSNERQAAYERNWFNPIMKEFRTEGCGKVFGTTSCTPVNSERTIVASAAFDIMGDDVDGIASMMEDAESMGMFG